MILKLCYEPENMTNKQTNEWLDEQVDKPEAICPPTFFKVGGTTRNVFQMCPDNTDAPAQEPSSPWNKHFSKNEVEKGP